MFTPYDTPAEAIDLSPESLQIGPNECPICMTQQKRISLLNPWCRCRTCNARLCLSPPKWVLLTILSSVVPVYAVAYLLLSRNPLLMIEYQWAFGLAPSAVFAILLVSIAIFGYARVTNGWRQCSMYEVLLQRNAYLSASQKSANQPIQSSGELGHIDVDDQPSPLADR